MPSHLVFVRENMLRYLRNSLTIAVPVTVITLCLGSMGAYAMSRLRTRLVDVALVTVLLLQVFPEALLATPMFIIFKSLGLAQHVRRRSILATSIEDARLRAGDPAADVPPGPDRARGGLARRRLHASGRRSGASCCR